MAKSLSVQLSRNRLYYQAHHFLTQNNKNNSKHLWNGYLSITVLGLPCATISFLLSVWTLECTQYNIPLVIQKRPLFKVHRYYTSVLPKRLCIMLRIKHILDHSVISLSTPHFTVIWRKTQKRLT